MRATGMSRKIDEMGRIVIPIEIRRCFDMNCNDSIDIYIENNNIILKKHDSVGMSRKIDEMGRIVIPIEIRRKFNLNFNDEIDIYTNEDSILLKRYEPFCAFCGKTDGLETFMEKKICQSCVAEIAKLLKK